MNYIHFGKRLKQIRLERGVNQETIAEKLGMKSNSYVSDGESGKFIPSDEKMAIWGEAIGLSWKEIEELKLEAEIERLGISDPSFNMMFKDFGNMTSEEKQSIIRAYESVIKARSARNQPKKEQ